MSRKSRYGRGNDYDHVFHAGNVGDVFKHSVLLAWLNALGQDTPRHVIDTHAGAGMHQLPSVGEWNAGIGRLDTTAETPPAWIANYLAAAGDRRRPNKGGLYPGSPAFIRGVLGENDRLSLVELADAPREKLSTHYATDAQVSIHGGDGLGYALECAKTKDERRLVVFIDPPYTEKAEWPRITEAIIALRAARPDAAILVWYPIKSLMRPQALAKAVQSAGVPAATIDLISTPLRLRKKALNGSGVLLVDPPTGFVEQLGSGLFWLARTLSAGEWSTAVRQWGKAAPSDVNHSPTSAN